jgi:nitrite reductase/ring-hydroxylating ferredoxin subunit
MAFVRVADLAELAPHGGTIVDVGARRVALFRQGGEVFALDNVCPHEGGPIGLGALERGVVACPRHGWQFDARTGACVSVPGAALAVWPTRVEGTAVYVDLDGASPPGGRPAPAARARGHAARGSGADEGMT